ncbi:competence protein ComK [Oceanobacillus jeddahense]|uniref:Competence protein ComK n=1 Tax=Oceanobacillus jeddahense TaxID=1462527 RepID=A0ABY5JXS7_9BACI|nr:competence protein ComK [Oceanobacillus jeddahense]UUI05193.1 competence protein ComK [Oceanobacillus jeddahense]
MKIREITPYTMAILSELDENEQLVTRVLEDDAEYLLEEKPTKIIEYACTYFGSDLKGRQNGIKSVSGITHKVPIPVDPRNRMYFFPTKSPTLESCSWISHAHIDNSRKIDNTSTEILFKNGRTISLDVSHGIIVNQIQRTAQIRYLIDERGKPF